MELLFATACLFAVTVVASFIYHKRIRQAQNEYESSKDLVRSITTGFTKQLSRVSRAIQNFENDASEARTIAREALETSQKAMESLNENNQQRSELTERLSKTETSIVEMRDEIQRLAKRPTPVTVSTQVDAPIPLRQDAVLDQLTPTELEVLTLIEELGEGSVPEIRSRILKTREHTARLLKKLFDRGFIDRNTSGMPYRYYLRKEIVELVQQQKEKTKVTL
ncbi:MAG: MarR family transcriptional regulator [Candidatus Bathyarchaeota archaeon]|nr:MAG: MarR family transcriptional regulator [Candidatus Bathyarchaeota archaeon]